MYLLLLLILAPHIVLHEVIKMYTLVISQVYIMF